MICVSRLYFDTSANTFSTQSKLIFICTATAITTKIHSHLHAVAPSIMKMVVKFPLLIGNHTHTHTSIDVAKSEYFTLAHSHNYMVGIYYICVSVCVCVCAINIEYNVAFFMLNACMHNANSNIHTINEWKILLSGTKEYMFKHIT